MIFYMKIFGLKFTALAYLLTQANSTITAQRGTFLLQFSLRCSAVALIEIAGKSKPLL